MGHKGTQGTKGTEATASKIVVCLYIFTQMLGSKIRTLFFLLNHLSWKENLLKINDYVLMLMLMH